MGPEARDFLRPSPGIQSDHPQVIALAAQVAGGAGSRDEKARRLFDFVRDTVRYSAFVPMSRLEDYLALATLARGKGYCVQKSTLLCTLARAAGIPARLGFADIKNHQIHGRLRGMIPGGVIHYHCFVEWRPGESWLKATTSFEAGLSAREGWRLVEFNPGQDALLPSEDLEGRPHVSYLQYRGWRSEVPLAEFLKATARFYGEEGLQLWVRAHETSGDEL